jgi:hypothetical protein
MKTVRAFSMYMLYTRHCISGLKEFEVCKKKDSPFKTAE